MKNGVIGTGPSMTRRTPSEPPSPALRTATKCLLFLAATSSCLLVNGMEDAEDMDMSALMSVGIRQCQDGEMILGIYFCDGIPDCSDGSDEVPQECNLSALTAVTRECDGGRRLAHARVCDGTVDCTDGSDEVCMYPECSSEEDIRCPTVQDAAVCIPASRICDGVVDCINSADETDCPLGESSTDCGEGMKLCPNLECVSMETECYDTASSTQLRNSTDAPLCYGQLSCHGSQQCVRTHRVCDGVQDCPLGDDERFCDQPVCPAACRCENLICRCEDISESQFYELSRSTRVFTLTFSSSYPTMTYTKLHAALRSRHLFYLHSLTMRGCNSLPLQSAYFARLDNLRWLDLRQNGIISMKVNIFRRVNLIEYVNLRDNPLTFVDLWELIANLNAYTVLDIALPSLSCCNLTENYDDHVQTTCLDYSSIFSCQYMVPVQSFSPVIFIMASLEIVLSIALWAACRALTCADSLRDLLVFSIGTAGFIMGLYLLAIGGQNVHVAGEYYQYDDAWRAGYACSLLSYFFTLSCFLTAMAMLLAAIHQFIVTRLKSNYYSESVEDRLRRPFKLCMLLVVIVAGIPTLSGVFRSYEDGAYSFLCTPYADSLLGQVSDSYAYIGVTVIEWLSLVVSVGLVLKYLTGSYRSLRAKRQQVQKSKNADGKQNHEEKRKAERSGQKDGKRQQPDDPIPAQKKASAPPMNPGLTKIKTEEGPSTERKKIGVPGVQTGAGNGQDKMAAPTKEKFADPAPLKTRKLAGMRKKTTTYAGLEAQLARRKEPEHPVNKCIFMLFNFTLCLMMLVSKNVFGLLGLTGAVRFHQLFILSYMLICLPAIHILIVASFTVAFTIRVIQDRIEAYKRKNRFYLRGDQMVCTRTGRCFTKMDTHLGLGRIVTPREVRRLARCLASGVRKYHALGQVCDQLHLEHILRSTDHQCSVPDFEMNTVAEFPKMDVHEWRMKRDIQLVGCVLDIVLNYIRQDCKPFDTPGKDAGLVV